MGYEVVLLEEVSIDVDEATAWYESHQVNLGIRFYFEILDQFEKLKTHPEHYGFVFKEFRQKVLAHFPFKIIFKIIGDKVIVFAVFHTSRNFSDLFKRI